MIATVSYETERGTHVSRSVPLDDAMTVLERLRVPARVVYRGAHVGGSYRHPGYLDGNRKWFRWCFPATDETDREIDAGFACDCSECTFEEDE